MQSRQYQPEAIGPSSPGLVPKTLFVFFLFCSDCMTPLDPLPSTFEQNVRIAVPRERGVAD